MTKPDLFIQLRGTGKPLVCLHGWGMHSGIFAPLANALQNKHQVVLLDLPGHGNSPPSADFANLNALTNHVRTAIEKVTTDKINVLAWSMGGLVAQWLVNHYPDRVAKLVLVSGTPCFEAKADWPYGIEHKVLQQFADGLEQDYQVTLDRFLALQFMGADNQKMLLRKARELVFRKPTPDIQTLRQGMQLLSSTDLRAGLQVIDCPLLAINGEHDKLVPTTAVLALADSVKHGQAMIFKGCGHAPFLSHPQLFIEQINQFLL